VCRKGRAHSGGNRSGRMPDPPCERPTELPNEPNRSARAYTRHTNPSREKRPLDVLEELPFFKQIIGSVMVVHFPADASRDKDRRRGAVVRGTLFPPLRSRWRLLSRVVRGSGWRRPRCGPAPRSESRHQSGPGTESSAQSSENCGWASVSPRRRFRMPLAVACTRTGLARSSSALQRGRG